MFDSNQRTVMEGRYLARDEAGNIVETPEEMFRRVARGVAAAEAGFGAGPAGVAEWAERFYALMADLDFLPNSPTLINCGRHLGQLAACFVVPVGDSIEEIFDALKYTAIIHQSGGGTGIDFSPIRPRNSLVRSTCGQASGPVSFMRVFNAATEEVRQGGVRRGANMGILRIDHPDICEFVSCKDQEGAFRNFNVSVAVPDRFFQAVEEGRGWSLSFNDRVIREVPARELLAAIARSANATGEPGLLLIDAINRANPTPSLGPISACNPCGEMPLLPYESCNLGSVNLSRMLRAPAPPGPTPPLRPAAAGDPAGPRPDGCPDPALPSPGVPSPGWAIDWDRLGSVVELAVRFLDDVIEVNRFPLPQIAEASRRNRKIGLGVMGWADLLFQLQVPYDSEQALSLAGEVMSFIAQRAREASAALARQRGVFPAWRESIFHPDQPLRHATLTTIAPTGSISALAGVSSGIEPVFALAYERTVLENKKLAVIDAAFRRWLETETAPEPRAILAAVQQTGSVQGLPGVAPELQAVFKNALEIAPEWHLRMQAAFQQHTDNAVSKTINLPAAATAAEVEAIFKQAHRLGLKGITVYRTGARSGQPLALYSSCTSCNPA